MSVLNSTVGASFEDDEDALPWVPDNPVRGYYEWSEIELGGTRARQPHFIHGNANTLAAADISTARKVDDECVVSTAIVTLKARCLGTRSDASAHRLNQSGPWQIHIARGNCRGNIVSREIETRSF